MYTIEERLVISERVLKLENNMTATNLRSAFSGESMAYMRYRIWGDHAKQEGYPNVSKLFEAIAYAEKVHASNHFQELNLLVGDYNVNAMGGFGLGNTSENLEGAIAGENFEIDQMYPSYMAVAELQGEKQAYRVMHWALEAEKAHVKLFSEAKTKVDQNQDIDLDRFQICGVCGYTKSGETPDVCPICGAKIEKFVEF